MFATCAVQAHNQLLLHATMLAADCLFDSRFNTVGLSTPVLEAPLGIYTLGTSHAHPIMAESAWAGQWLGTMPCLCSLRVVRGTVMQCAAMQTISDFIVTVCVLCTRCLHTCHQAAVTALPAV
jgi:hypothetical protein